MSGWNFSPSFDGRLETLKKRNNDKDANQKFDIFEYWDCNSLKNGLKSVKQHYQRRKINLRNHALPEVSMF